MSTVYASIYFYLLQFVSSVSYSFLSTGLYSKSTFNVAQQVFGIWVAAQPLPHHYLARRKCISSVRIFLDIQFPPSVHWHWAFYVFIVYLSFSWLTLVCVTWKGRTRKLHVAGQTTLWIQMIDKVTIHHFLSSIEHLFFSSIAGSKYSPVWVQERTWREKGGMRD